MSLLRPDDTSPMDHFTLSGTGPLSGIAGEAVKALQPIRTGQVCDVVGSVVRATGVRARLGELCRLFDPASGFEGTAEVTGFSAGMALLSPMGDVAGVSPQTQVYPTGREHSVAVGDFLLGRLVNGLGTQFIDDQTSVPTTGVSVPVWTDAPPPLQRPPIRQRLNLGVKSIDSILTVGRGQRLGIFAPAGCGKSTLLTMLSRHADVDITIVALVGERGREVAEFLETGLDESSRKRSIIVVSTSDRPANERQKAAFVATAYAEYFSAQGKSVLLLVDSVTRLARAAREFGLAAGEPPTRRGYPPSVFAMLPRLFERAGLTSTGSITAFYTVLEESDEHTDPVAEEVRSLLDGTLDLSRELAAKGHFPAIDLMGSISRLMPKLVDGVHLALALRTRELMSKYQEVELLLRIGEYQRGTDMLADKAIDCHESLHQFLQQAPDEEISADRSIQMLADILR